MAQKRLLRKVVFRLVALCLSLVIACAIGEVGLRVAGYNRSYVNPFGAFHQSDSVLGYRGKPDFAGRFHRPDFDVVIVHDENGFRRQEHEREPSEAQRNVYVLGDSFVWGYGVGQGKVVTDLMKTAMPGYRVENFALAGSGTVQQYTIFRSHVFGRLRPDDTVLLVFFGNDFGDNVGRILTGSRLYATVQDGEVRLVPPDGTLLESNFQNQLKEASCLVNLLTCWADRLMYLCATGLAAGRAKAEDSPAEQTPLLLSDDAPEIKVTRHFLAALKKDCDEKTARLLIAYVAGQAEIGEADVTFTENLSKAEQAACRQAFFRCTDSLGIQTIDLLPSFRQGREAGRFERLTFLHDFHWNEGGHAVAAEAISSFILARDAERVARTQTTTR
jgi:hypothetical protein